VSNILELVVKPMLTAYDQAAAECERLRLENEALQRLLRSALYHCETEGDDSLVTAINAALRSEGGVTSIEKTMSHVEREVYENEIGQLRREIEKLRVENAALRQPKSCGTCARHRDSAKCNNCALYYYPRPCQWIPAKKALRGEGGKT
jgi:hypothetical protein